MTQRNYECASKLIPTIKIVKSIIGTLPEARQLSGYHIESLSINIFKNYDGTKTCPEMVTKFFEKAKEAILKPIKDKTGQSIHVDDYLGQENNPARIEASYLLNRLHKRILNANAASSINMWETILGID